MRYFCFIVFGAILLLFIIPVGCEQSTAPTSESSQPDNLVSALFTAQGDLVFAWAVKPLEVQFFKVLTPGPICSAIIKVDGTQQVSADSIIVNASMLKPLCSASGLRYRTVPFDSFDWGSHEVTNSGISVQVDQKWQSVLVPVNLTIIRDYGSTVDITYSIAGSFFATAYGIQKQHIANTLSDGYINIL